MDDIRKVLIEERFVRLELIYLERQPMFKYRFIAEGIEEYFATFQELMALEVYNCTAFT